MKNEIAQKNDARLKKTKTELTKKVLRIGSNDEIAILIEFINKANVSL